MTSKTLLLIFVHGFNGNDDTFSDFPNYLADLLKSSVPETVSVKPLVYPQYETSGELDICVNSFQQWLLPFLQADDEPIFDHRQHAPITGAVLIGHSMGGILIAETVLGLPPSAQARVLGILAFDTPFLGLNPRMVSNVTGRKIDEFKKVYSAVSALRSFGAGNTGTSTAVASAPTASSATGAATASAGSSWMRWAAGAGGVAAVAATAAVAYSQRENVQQSVGWVDSHLRFVKVLFQPELLTARMSKIMVVKPALSNIYTVVKGSETFVKLPINADGWIRAENTKADDEIGAHMSMFTPKTNPGYWEMSRTARNMVAGWTEGWARKRVEPKAPAPDVRNVWEDEESWQDVPAQDSKLKSNVPASEWQEKYRSEDPPQPMGGSHASQHTIHHSKPQAPHTQKEAEPNLIDLSENPWA